MQPCGWILLSRDSGQQGRAGQGRADRAAPTHPPFHGTHPNPPTQTPAAAVSDQRACVRCVRVCVRFFRGSVKGPAGRARIASHLRLGRQDGGQRQQQGGCLGAKAAPSLGSTCSLSQAERAEHTAGRPPKNDARPRSRQAGSPPSTTPSAQNGETATPRPPSRWDGGAEI